MAKYEAIYIASKTKHSAMWRDLRKRGLPVISTWIDEAGVGETKSWEDLWGRCISEASSATGLILYGEPKEILKGAIAEVGAALCTGVPVAIVGQVDAMKNIQHHRLVIGSFGTIEAARRALLEFAKPTPEETN